MFRHLLQVQRAAVLNLKFQVRAPNHEMGAAYSSLGRIKVLYATSLVLLAS